MTRGRSSQQDEELVAGECGVGLGEGKGWTWGGDGGRRPRWGRLKGVDDAPRSMTRVFHEELNDCAPLLAWLVLG